jgi:tRNA A22 N-methylase
MCGEMMQFPETWEEFEKSYGFTDTRNEYTNGSRLIQSFRVKQWLDHIEANQIFSEKDKRDEIITVNHESFKDFCEAVEQYEKYCDPKTLDFIKKAVQAIYEEDLVELTKLIDGMNKFKIPTKDEFFVTVILNVLSNRLKIMNILV